MPLFIIIIIIIITDWIGGHELLLPINHENYNFTEQNSFQVGKERENFNFCLPRYCHFSMEKILHFEESPN